jgi:hypothetical protein
MAYERTWQFMGMQGPRVATSFADNGGYNAWAFKAFLMGQIGGINAGLWTVHGSCDGAVAAMDGVDRWGATYVPGQVAYNTTPTGAHGWTVLKRNFTVYSTTYTVYITIIATSFNVSNQGQHTMVASLAAPTGGSTTANPTQTQTIFSNFYTGAGNVTYGGDFVNSRRLYGAINSIGDFWFAETISGDVAQAWYFGQPIGCKTNDQAPFAIFGCYSHGPGVGQYPFAGYSNYTRSSGAVNATGSMPGLYYNGAVGYPALIAPPPWSLLDISDVSLFDYPAWVVVGNAQTPTQSHARGRLADVGLNTGYAGSGTISLHRPCNVGTTIRDGGNIVYVTLNQFIVPYNALLS